MNFFLKHVLLFLLSLVPFAAGTGISPAAPVLAAEEAQEASAPGYGTSGIVMDADTGRVFSGYNVDAKLPMASTTKVLTAITVIDAVENLDESVKVPAEAVGVEGSSIYLRAGEKLTYRQLLYGLMLQSGNDCAVALAVRTAGSVPAFAELMNAKAKEIGAVNSHFVNPHGLHDDAHYTTAYDLALITSYALKDPNFKEIVSTKKIKIPNEGYEWERVIVNKNKMLALYPGATGVKTGYTKRAGRCLVSSATRENVNLVCVVLNCGPMWEKSMEMMDAVFRDVVSVEVLPENCLLDRLPVAGSGEKTCAVGTRSARRVTVPQGTEDKLRTETVIEKRILLPVKKGEEIGKIQIYYGNQLLFSEKIYTMESIEDDGYLAYLKKIAERFCGYENQQIFGGERSGFPA